MNGASIPQTSVKLSKVVVDGDFDLGGHKIINGTFESSLPPLPAYKAGTTLTLLNDPTVRTYQSYFDTHAYRDNAQLVLGFPATIKRGSVVTVTFQAKRSAEGGTVECNILRTSATTENCRGPQLCTITSDSYVEKTFSLVLETCPMKLMFPGVTGANCTVSIKDLTVKADPDTAGTGVWGVVA